MHRIPTAEDWNTPLRSWEIRAEREYARDRFLGKSLAEAEELFFVDGIGANEDLSNMPAVPYAFYVRACVRALKSERMRADPAPDTAGAFLSLAIGEKLRHLPEDIVPVLDFMLEASEYVAAHQADFDAEPAIYGSFSDRVAELRTLADEVRRGRPNPG